MALSLEQYVRHNWYEEVSSVKVILTKRIERQRKRSIGVTLKNGNRIPDHLIIEILSRLPVRTLLQFKSVCKSWYALIKSSDFISEHLRNYYDNDTNWRDCLIVQYSTEESWLDVDELLIDNKRNRVLSYQEIHTPVWKTFLCSPCDGIYYLSCNHFPKRTLWNPALNELKILPDITWKPKFPHYYYDITESYGFGYDSKTKDYKVILIKGYRGIRDEGSSPMSIFIYSLKTNSWRHWGDVDKSYDLKENHSYVFVNGCYHWIGSSSHSVHYEMLISFDISEEVYKENLLPQFEKEPDDGSQLVIYHDSIGFVYLHIHYPSFNSSFSLWIWNEEVWTQKLRMKLKFAVCEVSFIQWRDETLLFSREDGKPVLCDTNTKKILFLDGPQMAEFGYISVYKESLVSIKDFN